MKNKHIFSLLKSYWKPVLLLSISTIVANVLYLVVPKFISSGIDSYVLGKEIGTNYYIQFTLVSFGIFLLTYFQGIFQTYLAEKASYDIRNQLADKISRLSYRQIETETSAKILTNFTSDIESIKMFLSFAVSIAISSVVVIIGAAILLLTINWKLALVVLALLPLIGILFALVFSKLGPLFKKSQEIIDKFNTIIGESVVGAAIVRVLDSGKIEYNKFRQENDISKENSMRILRYFSFVIPSVGIIANLASLIILVLGGKFVIDATMSLGDFTAFNSYVFILIFPIIMLGFISSTISRAQESYVRIQNIIDIEEEKDSGTIEAKIKGDVELKQINLSYGERQILKDVSFSLKAGTKTAIIGPTAAGKTQLLQILLGLTTPTSGSVLYDGIELEKYTRDSLYSQVAFVFQDSVMFNMSVIENISFSQITNDESINKAIKTAELDEFINTLPEGLNTSVSERGTSLSGGQKQRIMLARALALNPQVLFLDDFTARVDASTEKKILQNVEKNYPGITLVSVTQKIQSIEHFDKIILIMEGEVVAEGVHEDLIHSSTEYVQIMESQKSTQTYE
ncbi:MAG: ABC transporter ATP-binding protein [Candidatus Paceibacterota bacterium]